MTLCRRGRSIFGSILVPGVMTVSLIGGNAPEKAACSCANGQKARSVALESHGGRLRCVRSQIVILVLSTRLSGRIFGVQGARY